MIIHGIEITEAEAKEWQGCTKIPIAEAQAFRNTFRHFIARLRLTNYALELAGAEVSDEEFARKIQTYQPFPDEAL
jgi:hypothetical protein